MTFGSDQRLKNHLKNHEVTARKKHTCCSYTKARPHRCEECQICFSTNVDFLGHMKSSPAHKVPKETIEHTCELCGTTFTHFRKLQSHKLTHTQILFSVSSMCTPEVLKSKKSFSCVQNFLVFK